MKGQLGACAPRQPQWQHWGAVEGAGHGAAATARETGGHASGDDEGAVARVQRGVEQAVACMVVVRVIGGEVGW